MPGAPLRKPQRPAKERREIEELYGKICSGSAKLVDAHGLTEALPNSLSSFLHRVLSDLQAGNSVTIQQGEPQLTTQVASRMLGVSRQFLVNLLEKGEIPFHKVGTHRRVYARDLLAYKAKRDAARRHALDNLARSEHAEGLYESSGYDFRRGQ